VEARSAAAAPGVAGATAKARQLVEQADASLVDLIDNALNRGVMLDGEIVLSLGDVDLIYLRFSALVAAVDRVEGRRRR